MMNKDMNQRVARICTDTFSTMETIFRTQSLGFHDLLLKRFWPGFESGIWDSSIFTYVDLVFDYEDEELFTYNFKVDEAPVYWTGIPMLINAFREMCRADLVNWDEDAFEDFNDLKNSIATMVPYKISILMENVTTLEVRCCGLKESDELLECDNDTIEKIFTDLDRSSQYQRFYVGLFDGYDITMIPCKSAEDVFTEVKSLVEDGCDPLIIQTALTDDRDPVSAGCVWLTRESEFGGWR